MLTAKAPVCTKRARAAGSPRDVRANRAEHEVLQLAVESGEVLGVGGLDGAAVLAVESEGEQLARRVEDVEERVGVGAHLCGRPWGE